MWLIEFQQLVLLQWLALRLFHQVELHLENVGWKVRSLTVTPQG